MQGFFAKALLLMLPMVVASPSSLSKDALPMWLRLLSPLVTCLTNLAIRLPNYIAIYCHTSQATLLALP